jgi:transposase-like protein
MKNFQGFVGKLQRLISGNVIVNTDEYTIYEGIAEKIPEIQEHHIVTHSSYEWANGDVHVNSCENRNGFIRCYLRRYRGVSKKYLQGYLDFLAFLLNEKDQWFELILSDNSRT